MALTPDEFKRVCKFLWGYKWATDGADALAVSPRVMLRWASGNERNLPPDWLADKLREIARNRMPEKAAEMSDIARVLDIEVHG